MSETNNITETANPPIPKIIHYCWFGGNPLPDSAITCIESWKRFFPDYEIREWNESNYDIHCMPYVEEAYTAKNWAFVSDVTRFDILYKYGGIYFDTDVEVIKPFGKILDTPFMGLEDLGSVAAGLGLGCNAGLGFFDEVLKSFRNDHFILYDKKGHAYHNIQLNVVRRVSALLKIYGFNKYKNTIQKVAGLTIYPTEYLCPKSFITGITTITDKSVAIHHYNYSWSDEQMRQRAQRRRNDYQGGNSVKIFFKYQLYPLIVNFAKTILPSFIINRLKKIIK